MNRKQKRRTSSAKRHKASAKDRAVATANGRTWKIVLSVGGFVVTIAILAAWPRKESDFRSPPNIASDGPQEIDPAVLEAVRVARQAVIDNPDSPDRWGQLGMVFAAHAFDDSAASCFAAASELLPTHPRWAYLHARCKMTSAPDEGMALLEKCIDLADDPFDTPRLFLIEKLLENQQLDEAEKHLNRSMAKHPKNARTRFAKARLHFMREEYLECKNEIISTHRNIKGRYEAAVQRANVLAAEGRNEKSQLALNKANQLLQASLCQQKTIGLMLAAAMLRLGDAEGSRKQQELANEQTDTPWPDPHTRGIAKLKTGLVTMLSKSSIAHDQKRYSDALAILQKAISQYPDSVFARIGLGRTRIRLGRMAYEQGDLKSSLQHYQEAERHLTASLALDANSVEAHFRLGVLMLYWSSLKGYSEKLAEAEQLFRKAIAIKSDFEMAYFDLARCLDKQKRFPEAIEAMRQTLRLDPNNISAQRSLGGLLMKAGQLQEAIIELEKTIQLAPNDRKAREWLKMIRHDLGTAQE